MNYSKDYLHSKDIDWFCMVNGRYIHVASAGGSIPDEINDVETLRDLQRNVFLAPDIFNDDDILINQNFLENRFGLLNNREIAIANYLESFKYFARKGFVSLDRTNLAECEDNTYHVVCMPRGDVDGLQIENIPHFFANRLQDISQNMENISLLNLLEEDV